MWKIATPSLEIEKTSYTYGSKKHIRKETVKERITKEVKGKLMTSLFGANDEVYDVIEKQNKNQLY